MNPRGVLREEHGNIMKMLAVLQRFLATLADLKEGEAKDLKTLIEFFEIYVDRYHHGKEEQLLFPVLSRARIAKIDSLISSLIDDHRQARMAMEELKFNVMTIRDNLSCSVHFRLLNTNVRFMNRFTFYF
jgi:hemerythrin-like domain-containing protein